MTALKNLEVDQLPLDNSNNRWSTDNYVNISSSATPVISPEVCKGRVRTMVWIMEVVHGSDWTSYASGEMIN